MDLETVSNIFQLTSWGRRKKKTAESLMANSFIVVGLGESPRRGQGSISETLQQTVPAQGSNPVGALHKEIGTPLIKSAWLLQSSSHHELREKLTESVNQVGSSCNVSLCSHRLSPHPREKAKQSVRLLGTSRQVINTVSSSKYQVDDSLLEQRNGIGNQ